MLSPFPGMDPFLQKNPIFHELHTQMLAEMQRLLQPQLRPKYTAPGTSSCRRRRLGGPRRCDLARCKEPDVTITKRGPGRKHLGSTALLAQAAGSLREELDADELELRKQRRIVIYVRDRPRLAVTGIELLSPGNKQPGAVARVRYLEKRASALHGGLHWVEIDLLRGGAAAHSSAIARVRGLSHLCGPGDANGLEPPGLRMGVARSAAGAADPPARRRPGSARPGRLFRCGVRRHRRG